MTTLTTNLAVQPLFSGVARVITAPFRMIWRGLMAVAEANSRYQAVEQLNAQSDADLAGQGTTRHAEIMRIFASSGVV